MPIIAFGASSRQRPPFARTNSSLDRFHSRSESSRTPSRSKITASTTRTGLDRAPHELHGVVDRERGPELPQVVVKLRGTPRIGGRDRLGPGVEQVRRLAGP